MTRSTHTFATLELSLAAFEEIKQKLEVAGYDHAILKDDDGSTVLDMHGIGVTRPPIERTVTETVSLPDRRKRYSASLHKILFDPAPIKEVMSDTVDTRVAATKIVKETIDSAALFGLPYPYNGTAAAVVEIDTFLSSWLGAVARASYTIGVFNTVEQTLLLDGSDMNTVEGLLLTSFYSDFPNMMNPKSSVGAYTMASMSNVAILSEHGDPNISAILSVANDPRLAYPLSRPMRDMAARVHSQAKFHGSTLPTIPQSERPTPEQAGAFLVSHMKYLRYGLAFLLGMIDHKDFHRLFNEGLVDG